ncbi:hypothetical protein FACS189472_17530 [Alphaproteobacteria bacterium]|nr:hypothetical protein FACS189472_17530 [Alphaproteobacteria bacterium]
MRDRERRMMESEIGWEREMEELKDKEGAVQKKISDLIVEVETRNV